MTSAAPDLLARAFESAAGRDDGRGLPHALLAFARGVVAAGRAALEVRCPMPVVRRAEALFGSPRGAGARLFRLVLDSWAGLAPATRGRGPRLLRYDGPGLGLDVELEPLPDGRTRVRAAVSRAEGRPPAGLALVLEAGGRSRRVALDAEGAGEVVLPRTPGSVRLRVVREGTLVARTPALPRR